MIVLISLVDDGNNFTERGVFVCRADFAEYLRAVLPVVEKNFFSWVFFLEFFDDAGYIHVIHYNGCMITAQTCTLYLVRHGQTDWNVSKTIQGQLDIPLNKKGEEQAEELRRELESIHFDALFSSDLLRAKRTAELLNLERQLVLETTMALRERAFGTYQGKQMDEAHDKIYHLLENYKNHPHLSESGVETNEAMVSRALTFIREISVAYPSQTVLLVTHGGLMRTLLIHLGYCTNKQFPPFGSIKNLAYIKLCSDGSDIEVAGTSGISILPV